MIFDGFRKQHSELYTEHPLMSMSDQELEKLAKEAGFDDVEAFKMFCFQPSEQMTCPLCGRPQNHLSDCKGCGKFPFTDGEFLDAYGEDAPKRLKAELKKLIEKHHPNIAEYAVKNAYNCMVCRDCWQEAIASYDAYQTCPLRLFSDLILNEGFPQVVLMEIGWKKREPKEWFEAVWERWTANKQAAEWRKPILEAVFQGLLHREHKKHDVDAVLQEIQEFLGLDEEKEG